MMIEDIHRFLSIGNFNIPIIETPYAIEHKEVKRAWRERLFSWPWRPWVKTKIVVEPAMFIVNRNLLKVWTWGNAALREYIIAHPTLAAQIKNLIVEMDSVEQKGTKWQQ